MKWICATVAPWAMAGGVLISFTAAANNNPSTGVSAAGRSPIGLAIDMGVLIPSAVDPLPSAGRPLQQAALRFDLPDESAALLRHLPPREDLKAAPPPYPEVDRSRKGDPVVSLKPTLSRRAGEVRQQLEPGAARLMFSRDERLLPPTILMEGKVEGPPVEEPGFEPWQSPDLTTTRQATSVQSPAAAAAGSTGAAASATTPSVSRALALSSATPAPADATPVEIAAAPVSPPPQSPRLDRGRAPDTTVVARIDPDRPRYVDLIDPDSLSREQRCLAEAVYFEARSESEEGQAAVAQVVLNRMKSGLYPASICGVVYQNRHRHLACQFTFACEGKSLRITDRESWDTAKRVASEVLEGKTYLAEVGASTHYHADYVKPSWSRRLKKMDVIGRHIFYKLRPGQT
ncbi:MAG TPA: cell wall hydrolase [Microvirga sp.]|jgi:spore germination cell wall hydrolase CwlJ-like protein